MEEFQLWCCAEGDRTYFKVSIISSQDIDTLKVKIYNTAPNFFTGCDPKDLTLTKVDVDLDSVMGAIFRGQYQPDVKDELLSPHREISNVWPEQPPRQNLHVFITMEGREHKRKRDDATATVVPREVKLLKTETGQAITCNRMFEYNTVTLPLVLLHEAFGKFKDRCKAPPSERALTFLDDLTNQACRRYQEETQRKSAIQSVFRDHLGVRFRAEKVPNTEFTTDGSLVVTIMPAAIRECRNETGNVLNQAILYYSQFLSQALADRRQFYNFNTSFPCILMVDMDSSTGFYGAAWDGEGVRVEPLALGLDLATHLKERNTRHTMASCFDAFVLAIENIQAHYGSIEAEANQAHPQYDPHIPLIQKTRRYPFLTSYNEGGQETRFTYDRRLEEDKLVFSATVDQPGSGKRVVKFTCHYSEGAHNYLASRGLAPMIRKCVRISADWTAIVMDKSTYRVLYGLQLSEAQRTKVKCKVQSIVETLHEGGFVHGDIRDANLLIDEASLTSDDVAVHLIDFDWAGCIGEAKYPMGTNCKTVRRPAGVKGGEVITEQHDIEMVSYLFSN